VKSANFQVSVAQTPSGTNFVQHYVQKVERARARQMQRAIPLNQSPLDGADHMILPHVELDGPNEDLLTT